MLGCARWVVLLTLPAASAACSDPDTSDAGMASIGSTGSSEPTTEGGATSATSTDGSGLGPVTTDADSESDDADGSTEAGPASPLQMWCDAGAAFVADCDGGLSECETARMGACLEVYGVERAEFIEARAACGFPETCAGLQSFDERLCIYNATQSVEPTALQDELAAALCTACQPDAKDCLNDFFFVPEPMEGSTGVGGLGSIFLGLDDALVTTLLQQCVPDTDTSCVQTYIDCLDDVQSAAQPAEVTEACNVVGPG